MSTATVTPPKSKMNQYGPHSGRSVLIAPNLRVNLATAGHPLADYVPRTKLGRVALDFTMATSVSLISVAATTAYVYSVTELALPVPTFGPPPAGVPIVPADLQTAFQNFSLQLATLQGQAAAWIDVQPGTSTPSIFSQLVSIPDTFSNINGSVQTQFTILSNTTPGSAAYNKALQTLQALIGAETPTITGLNSQMVALGTTLLNATDAIQTAGTTGVLQQLYQAYEADISELQTAIRNANSTISSDNSKIIGLGFAAGGAIVVGLIGLTMIWNPLGWIMIGGGAVGAYYAITEILALKAQIAGLKNQIQIDTAWTTTYGQAAASISATITQTQGFAAMNAAAQQELTVLEGLMTSLAKDITTALNDLSADPIQLQDALAEWSEIVSAAAVLTNVTAYVWPSPILLSDPTAFAAAGSDVYAVSPSGQAYHYSAGNWSAVADKSLSIVAAGVLAVGINGAPADGANVSPTPYTTDYKVKQFNAAANAWTTISTFPAAQIATDGTLIYAINQLQADRRVYQYSGTGTGWTALPQFDSDAAQVIAIAGGKVFALLTNSQATAYWNGTNWNDLALFAIALSGNGTKLGLIDLNNYSWLYDAASNTWGNNGISTGSSILRLAQLANGDQLIVNTSLNLYYLNNQVSPTGATLLKSNAVGVAVSDTGIVYYSDNAGNSYVLVDLANNQWTQMPATPAPAN